MPRRQREIIALMMLFVMVGQLFGSVETSNAQEAEFMNSIQLQGDGTVTSPKDAFSSAVITQDHEVTVENGIVKIGFELQLDDNYKNKQVEDAMDSSEDVSEPGDEEPTVSPDGTEEEKPTVSPDEAEEEKPTVSPDETEEEKPTVSPDETEEEKPTVSLEAPVEEESVVSLEISDEVEEDSEDDQEDMEDDIYQGFEDFDKLPVIQFTATFQGDAFDENPIMEQAKEDILTITVENKNYDIGTYRLERTESGAAKFTVEFDKIVYFLENVEVGGSFSLKLKDDSYDGAKPTFKYDQLAGGIVVDIVKEEEDDEDKIQYTISKHAESQMTTNELNYDIYLCANKKDESKEAQTVNGKTFVDTIPDGLELVSATANGRTLENTEYILDGNRFSYLIPEYETDNLDQGYAIQLHTRLTGTNYINIIKQTPQAITDFRNTAFLYGKDPSKELAHSDTTDTKLNMTFFEKSGQRGSNGRLINWTLKGDTYFSKAANVYVVDSIDDISAHEYSGDAITIRYYENGEYHSVSKRLEDAEGTLVSYDDLTIEKLALLTSNGENCVTYKVDTNGDSEVDEQVLIIPLASSGSSFNYINRPFEIKYETIVAHATPDHAGEKELRNKAKLLWEWMDYGDGTEPPQFDVSLEKGANANYNLVEKKAGNYVPVTQQMTWNFDINEYGTNISTLIIEDSFDHDKQLLDERLFAEDGTILVTKHVPNKSDETLSVNHIDTFSVNDTVAEDENFYTIEDDGSTSKIMINLNDLTADATYTFSLNSKVVDHHVLCQQSDSIASGAVNTVSSSALIGSDIVTKTQTVTKNISNRIVTKAAIKFETGEYYDYNEQSVKWKVVANPYQFHIDSGSLVDELPIGTELGTITSVKMITSTGEAIGVITDGKITFDDGTEISYQEEKAQESNEHTNVTYTFKNPLDAIFNFEYTTKFTDEYRQSEFIHGKSMKVVNKVTLHGFMGDAEVNAKTSAECTISTPPMKKYGEYKVVTCNQTPDTPLIEWSIIVNKNKLDMTGMEVTDQLSDIFELCTSEDSSEEIDDLGLSVETVKVISAEKIKAIADVTEDFASDLTLSDNEFSLKIPDTVSNSALKITFYTKIVEDANANAMKNAAKLSWGDGNVFTTDNVQANGALPFDLGIYASASKPTYIAVTKTSTNTSYDNGMPNFRIPGAEFTMEQLKQVDGEWVVDSNSKAKVRKTSVKNGTASFILLHKNKLYRIYESKAPEGYQLPTEPAYHYVVFSTSKASEDQYPQGTKIVKGNKADIIVEDHPGDVDTPTAGAITFVKQTVTGQALKNITFRLNDKDKRLEEKTAVSDENGQVVFHNVDAGIYYITEDKVDYLKETTDYLVATVTYNSTSHFTTVMKNGTSKGKNPIRVIATGGGYVVPNEYEVPKPTATPTPKPTATPTVTPKPTATPTVTPKPTATPAVTPKPTAIPTVTPKPTATPTVTPKPTATPTPTLEPTPTEPIPNPDPAPLPDPDPNPGAGIYPGPDPEPVVPSRPEVTPSPAVTPKPSVTPEPSVTAKPAVTPTIQVTPAAEPKVTPGITESEKPTSAPDKKPTEVPAQKPIDPSTDEITPDATGIPKQENMRRFTPLVITKTSKEDKVEGYVYQVTGENFSKTYTTDEQGKIVLELLPGRYVIEEISAPIGYPLDHTRQVFEVSEEITRYGTIYYDLTEEGIVNVKPPKTGDDSLSMRLLLGLTALSFAGAMFFLKRLRRNSKIK